MSPQRQTNWFNRPFDKVTFDNNPVVATTVLLQETLSGTKDMGFEQQYRANKDTMKSYGLNAAWDVTDRFKVTVDGHISKADSAPDAPNGTSSTLGQHRRADHLRHSVDFSGDIPVQSFTINDAPRAATATAAGHRRPGQPGRAHLGPAPAAGGQGDPRRRRLGAGRRRQPVRLRGELPTPNMTRPAASTPSRTWAAGGSPTPAT
jgi:hypothetical protein